MNQNESKSNIEEYVKTGSNYLIRHMLPNEKKKVRSLLWRCFPITEAWPFRFTPNVLVVLHDNQIVGTVVLRLFKLPKKKKGGFVEYIFTAPEVRGMGFGQRLVEASIEYLNKLGCDEIVTQVKADNTSSSKLFSTRGFYALSPGQQLKHFGIGIIPLWLGSMHILAKGQLLWVNSEVKNHDHPRVQWWGNLILNILLFMLLSVRQETGVQFNLITFIGISIIIIYYFGIRYISMLIMAKKHNLDVRYRPIEDWFGMSFIFALGGSVWIPVPGNVYPNKTTWSYRDYLHKLGPMAFVGSLSILVSAYIIYFLLQNIDISSDLISLREYVLMIGAVFSLLEVSLPFFPFEIFNGRRIWDWNKFIWLFLTLCAIALFVITFFFN